MINKESNSSNTILELACELAEAHKYRKIAESERDKWKHKYEEIFVKRDNEKYIVNKDLQARVEAVKDDRDKLREAVRLLLECPTIVNRPKYPCHDTRTAVAVQFARDTLRFIAETKNDDL